MYSPMHGLQPIQSKISLDSFLVEVERRQTLAWEEQSLRVAVLTGFSKPSELPTDE